MDNNALERTVESIKNSAFFSVVTEERVRRLAEQAERRSYEAGAYLFVEFSPTDEIFLIEEGEVKVELALVNSEADLASVMVGAGESLGEVGFVMDAPRSGTAIAVTPVTVLAWNADHLRAWCDRHPDDGYYVMRQIARVLAERLRAWNVRVLDSVSWGLDL